MQRQTDQQDDAAYYIRWSPDSGPYAIELKLDLVNRIVKEISEAGAHGVEVGGVLFGTFPKANIPVVRIEDIEMIPRRAEDGPVYMLDPVQHQRFAGARWRAKNQNKVTIGFFRSHVRPGPLRPSLADRSLLSGQFSQSVYVFLLIQAREPRTAALFVATNGQLADEPSVREFRFDQAEFSSLPEIQPDAPQQEHPSKKSTGTRNRWLKPLAVPILIAIFTVAILWWISRRTAFFEWIRPSPDQLQLEVRQSGDLLQISWNHNARELNRASGATLVIGDGASGQEIKLGPDELKLGVVDYQPSSRQVHVAMKVNAPGSKPLTESVEWPRK
ncbi:MAG: hypothetical protein JOZ48_03340 [Acidobacteriaceae bacterium]|nr:hypothetical protein [Acidobacteriaceae bacterium]